MKLLRALKHTYRSILERILWLTRFSKEANFDPIRVNMLVVNKRIYSKLAYLCVLSFLFYHPNSKILIHYDQATRKSLRLRFLIFSALKRDRIQFVKLRTLDEWQMHKLEIILRMLGTGEYFMDCDLRWNGPLPETKSSGITYFVKEKRFIEYNGLDAILVNIPVQPLSAIMRNTSVFSWGGTTLSESQIQEFRSYVHRIQNNCKSSSYESSMSLSRIYEQISLSLIPELYDKSFRYLKDSDRQFDGSICESSYYGASGGRFAWWGNTSRGSLLIKKRS